MTLHMVGAPTPDRFDSNFVGGHPVTTVRHVTGRSYGDTTVHRIEAANVFEFLLEFLTALLQQSHIRLTILQQFPAKIKHMSRDNGLRVPVEELLLAGWRHTIRVIIFHVRDDSHIKLVGNGIKKMGKEPLFFSSASPKVLGKADKGMGKKFSKSINLTWGS